jgi:dihydroorotase
LTNGYELLLKNGDVWTPSGPQRLDVGVRDGRITDIGSLSGNDAAEVLDLQGLTVLPGVIDSQVHFREPGLEHKEDLESGTRGAVLGGVTAVFEMPNTKPPTDTAEALAFKLERAQGRAHCDHAFFIGATDRSIQTLAELELLPGCSGVKIFMGSSTGGLLVETDDSVRAALASGHRRVAIHAEDEPRLRARHGIAEEKGVPSAHAEWRDAESARLATERALRIARSVGRKVHILHVTTGDELPLLAAGKDVATCEVTPQHLTLSAPECYERLGTHAQMNPPIRDESHRLALWRGVNAGLFDVLGSDHAPHTLEEKSKPYPSSPSGMPGVQTLVPLMLNHVAQGRLSLQRFVDLTSAGPQRVFSLCNKGRIALGYDADFTVVDLETQRTIEASWIASKAGWTPFDGMKVTGWPIHTIVRGQVVVRDEALQIRGAGQPVRFLDTLPAAN